MVQSWFFFVCSSELVVTTEDCVELQINHKVRVERSLLFILITDSFLFSGPEERFWKFWKAV